MPSDNRVTVTIKLTPGKDDDLIDWFQSLPKGDYSNSGDGRQSAIKRVLRESMGLPQPQQQTPRAIEPLFSELAYLRSLIEQRPTPDADDGRIGAIEHELTKAIDWINYLNRQIEGLTLPGGSPAQEPVVEAVPQMSDDEISKRANKLKKASW